MERLFRLSAAHQRPHSRSRCDAVHGFAVMGSTLPQNGNRPDPAALSGKGLYDFVIAGGGSESHGLKKEVNFSDTLVIDGELCRIPGSSRGAKWATIKAHGWFSYEIKVRPNTLNRIGLRLGSLGDNLDIKITLGEKATELHQGYDSIVDIELEYAAGDEKCVRIRFDKISVNPPAIFLIKVY